MPENQKHLLIVDDEGVLRSAIAERLADHGFVVEQAGNGEDALQRLTDFAFDILITDLRLPGIGGGEVLDAALERYPDIRFRTLYLTARQGDAFQIVGELTMKGRAGEVILDTESRGVTLDPGGCQHARFSAKSAIRRRDFGASGNVGWDRYGIMIGERIDIEIDVEAVRQAAAAISFSSDIPNLTVTRA